MGKPRRNLPKDAKEEVQILARAAGADVEPAGRVAPRQTPNTDLPDAPEIYGSGKLIRALEDAHQLQAYSCEYIANILEQRARPVPQPGPLHLTRASDLLELELPEPDLSVYQTNPQPPHDHTNTSTPTK